ncbi:MAG TPA: hypothetical protein VFP92_10365 [Rhodanobacteraceae bacterium]|nr:hypothetical protein [Rhodanobacteraceae bacterium]
MKRIVAAAAILLLAPIVAHAACTPANFKLASFEVKTGDVSNPVMQMPGKLVNDCKEPAAAQLEIQAKAADGSVVQERKFWPAGTANIAPGGSVHFDAGRMFHFKPSMKTYAITIVAVRSW